MIIYGGLELTWSVPFNLNYTPHIFYLTYVLLKRKDYFFIRNYQCSFLFIPSL